MTKVAFDVDGTLIWEEGHLDHIPDSPKYSIYYLLHTLQKCKDVEIIVWSGGGTDYAERWCEKLGITARVIPKGSELVDIAFDDMEVKLGKVNIQV